MKILVINCGSSSIKYKLFEKTAEITQGLVERIGEKGSKTRNHGQGIKLMIEQLVKSGKIKRIEDIRAVGHRVVHGGVLSKPCIITKKVISAIKKYSKLAPLHNPANLKGIVELKKVLPNAVHVAVFDTAFHQTMPERAFTYALPYELCKKEGIRRYGFHGTSHYDVSVKAAKMLEVPFAKLNAITCHLGAGCSIAAVKNGKVVDTSMGFTPMEGLVMGTRSGDIDPGIILHLAKNGMSFKKLDELLNKKSGLAGISGVGKDMRLVMQGVRKGNERCKLALEVFCYRLKKYISAYAGILESVDAVVFTGGIGENVPLVRELSADIKILGIKIDKSKNQSVKEGIISAPDSRIKVLVIPTDEERVIAEETEKLA